MFSFLFFVINCSFETALIEVADDHFLIEFFDRIIRSRFVLLSGKRIDAAFLVLDDRLEGNYDKGMSWFLSVCTPAYTLPMHFWEDRTVVKRYLAQRPQTETAILDTTCETHWDLNI